MQMSQVLEYVEKLKLFIPEFPSYWASDDAAFNFGEDSTVHGVFSELSTLVVSRLEAGTLYNGKDLFTFIESVVAGGGDPANAACTCFLENILNCTPGRISSNSFTPYLGPRSKEFCCGWGKFTGVETSGL